MRDPKEWIGVDFDGTLATYDGFKGLTVLGDPVPAMVNRVKGWLAEGRRVKILTARVAQSVWRPQPEDVYRAVLAIEDWCEEHLGQRLEVTCIKDFGMSELWDDRVVQVEKNTGRPTCPSPRGLK